MKNILIACFLLLITSCASVGSGSADPTKGPVVLGKHKGAADQTWLPYSTVAAETSPVIATEGFVKANAQPSSPNFNQAVSITQSTLNPKLKIEMYNDSSDHDTAPTDIIKAQYVAIGGSEWTLNSYRLIGFGYRSSADKGSPVAIGALETNTKQDTNADFVVATRNGTTGAPTVKFLVKTDGQIVAAAGYTPNSDLALANKSYVDKHALSTVRPSNPVAGAIYFDKDKLKPEFFDGASWRFSDGTTAP